MEQAYGVRDTISGVVVEAKPMNKRDAELMRRNICHYQNTNYEVFPLPEVQVEGSAVMRAMKRTMEHPIGNTMRFECNVEVLKLQRVAPQRYTPETCDADMLAAFRLKMENAAVGSPLDELFRNFLADETGELEILPADS